MVLQLVSFTDASVENVQEALQSTYPGTRQTTKPVSESQCLESESSNSNNSIHFDDEYPSLSKY